MSNCSLRLLFGGILGKRNTITVKPPGKDISAQHMCLGSLFTYRSKALSHWTCQSWTQTSMFTQQSVCRGGLKALPTSLFWELWVSTIKVTWNNISKFTSPALTLPWSRKLELEFNCYPSTFSFDLSFSFRYRFTLIEKSHTHEHEHMHRNTLNSWKNVQ